LNKNTGGLVSKPRKLPKNRRTRRWPDTIKLLGVEMNIFSLKELAAGIFDRNPLLEAFNCFQPMPGTSFYQRFAGKCNQRRARNRARSSVFANRRIARGF
jgi:hypothetical protein